MNFAAASISVTFCKASPLTFQFLSPNSLTREEVIWELWKGSGGGERGREEGRKEGKGEEKGERKGVKRGGEKRGEGREEEGVKGRERRER